MESNMVNNLIDNKNGIPHVEAMLLIKSIFSIELSNFSIEEDIYGGAFFSLIYIYKHCEIFIGGDRGYLEYYLKVNNEKVNLINYDKKLENIELVSDKNIRYVFYVIKKKLENNYLI
ncbi:MAG: hypothetical protein ACK5M3_19080 [Dysgonomonas sp.]